MMPIRQSRQKIMRTLGEYGCYFLSIIYIAEQITRKRVDAVEEFERAMEAGSLDDEATVLRPDEILSHLTGRECSVRKEGGGYRARDDEREILVFRDKYTHFVVGNGRPLVGEGRQNVVYDPLGDSSTVRNGSVESKRIFRIS